MDFLGTLNVMIKRQVEQQKKADIRQTKFKDIQFDSQTGLPILKDETVIPHLYH